VLKGGILGVDKKKKQQKKKRDWGIFSLLIGPSALCVVGLFCFKSALPFSVEEIRPVRDFSFQAAQTSSQEELERFRSVFSKPFVYLKETDLCYVFVSENSEYIIKFFKMRKLTPKYWLNYVPFPWLEEERLNKIGHRERTRQELFSNLKIAFEEFRHQTALVFVHFFSTNWLKTKVQLLDPQNSSHVVSLDTVPFVLQRNPKALFEYVEELIQKEKTKEAISSLLLVLDLVKDRCQRGLADQDSDLEYDYGFIGGRAVFTHIGRMKQDDSLKTPLSTLREVFKVSQKITDWLKKNHPSLAEEFQKEAQDLLSLLEEL
jgi:hypothetical protein